MARKKIKLNPKGILGGVVRRSENIRNQMDQLFPKDKKQESEYNKQWKKMKKGK